MQVLQKVKETESLGREFLLWLWFRSETEKGVFDLGEAGKAEVWFDGKITLQAEDDRGVETIICSGNRPDMKEARFALSEKKEISRASVRLRMEDNQWSFILDAAWMNFRSFKTPRVVQDRKEDPDGIFYEKALLIETAVSAMDAIYAAFIRLRVSPEWEMTEGPALQKWIDGAP